MRLEHQPHPGTTRPAWAIASPEYLATHAACNHAWGTCTVTPDVQRALCSVCGSGLVWRDGANRCLRCLHANNGD